MIVPVVVVVYLFSDLDLGTEGPTAPQAPLLRLNLRDSIRSKEVMKFKICCKECGSEKVTEFVQLFRNGTEHYYVKCKSCRHQFYAPSKFIHEGLERRESKKLKKQKRTAFNYFLNFDI